MGLFSSSSKSDSASTQYATDKRQVAYDAPAISIDLNKSGKGAANLGVNIKNNLAPLTGNTLGAGSSINILDGGAIASSFDFVQTALYQLLDFSISTQNKAASESAAVRDSSLAAINEISQFADQKTADADQAILTSKNMMIAGAMVLGALYIWKGR